MGLLRVLTAGSPLPFTSIASTQSRLMSSLFAVLVTANGDQHQTSLIFGLRRSLALLGLQEIHVPADLLLLVFLEISERAEQRNEFFVLGRLLLCKLWPTLCQ